MTGPAGPPADDRGPDEDWDWERDGDFHDPGLDPAWFPGSHLPEHARRAGLTHHTQEGALLDFAGALDPRNRVHRLTAWVMLAVFALPVLRDLLRLLGSVLGG